MLVAVFHRATPFLLPCPISGRDPMLFYIDIQLVLDLVDEILYGLKYSAICPERRRGAQGRSRRKICRTGQICLALLAALHQRRLSPSAGNLRGRRRACLNLARCESLPLPALGKEERLTDQ